MKILDRSGTRTPTPRLSSQQPVTIPTALILFYLLLKIIKEAISVFEKLDFLYVMDTQPHVTYTKL
jgi:hypothetical protein